MSKLRHALIALSMPAVLWGCGPEDLMDVSAEPPAAQDLTTQGQELATANTYTWSQGNIATPMGTTVNRTCYLMRVGGDFEGGGERVDIFQTGSSWYLGGNSSQTGINGAAGCINVADTGTEYTWTQSSSYPTYLGSSTNRVCYLTGVAGKFHGGGEWVHVYETAGSWYMTGNSSQSGVRARARCINLGANNTFSPEYTWSQGNSATALGGTAGRSCALTFVRGKFEGGGEHVRTYQAGGSWYLGGASGQVSVAARARCF
ncbi:hypothetical protein BHS06_22295 [Myxococcus xanthus]|uniref:hypothetical protein n=1 Tax=Myxococcus xanthus TaxID=34 RepID=UPI00112B3C53|nr:hypothetical protein [Myxococcus xanthus]QDE91485.1 hypothetical protein BHS06_22295 [Myxococcus xanthus]